VRDEAAAAYFIEHAPGLKQYYEAKDQAFSRIEDDALARHPDPTLDDIAAAEAVEAALPSRKRTEAQLLRDFAPLATTFRGGKASAERLHPESAASMEQGQPHAPDSGVAPHACG
jgi:hypothetical protein